MKFSEKWLREWENPPVDTRGLSEQLSMEGLEVASVAPVAGKFTQVVIGHVVACEQHPDADRLRCCEVDVGSGVVPIVCGGANVRAGLKVAVAIVGAVLGEDFKIKKAKLRGMPSEGMICSEKELGLAEESDGIMELPHDAPIGMDVREYLNLNDHIIDIEITPNRGDCLSIHGIARDNAVVNQLDVKMPDIVAVTPTITDTLPITLQDESACPRYVGRIIRNINPAAVTPLWMQERLRRSGVRCIHPIVDVGNYVMLELGQPMHAFDLSTLSDAIIVRRAQEKEKIKLLDGRELSLRESVLVVADEAKAQAIAGIMGGADSGVTAATRDVFLESAYFNAVDVAKTAKDFGLSSDSAYRFERGVDYQLQAIAIERATALILEIAGGEVGPLCEATAPAAMPKSMVIDLPKTLIKRLLGIEMEDRLVESILQALGMAVEKSETGWRVGVPSYRFDMQYPADVVEELARIYGYNNIAAKPLLDNSVARVANAEHIPLMRIKHVLVDCGYHEIISYSFIDGKTQTLLEPGGSEISLANPISQDLAVMRSSLWAGLLKTMQYNQNRQVQRHRLFEAGLCFQQVHDDWLQIPRLGILMAGAAHPEHWGGHDRMADFYDLKGDVENILKLTHGLDQFTWKKGNHPALHPGQSAALYKNNQIIGHLGALHPKIAQQMDLNQVPFLCEIELSVIGQSELPQFAAISKFPSVRRDLAITVDQSLEVGDILEVISDGSGKILNKIEIFDIYQGDNIEKGKKSVALGLTFLDPSRTLIDGEINDVIQDVVAKLERELKATLRA